MPTIPTLSAAEMAAVDALSVARGLQLVQMMENAGSLLARLVHGEVPAGAPILVLAGPGGNGGGALVAARRLAGFGHPISVFPTADPDRFTATTAHQWRLLEKITSISLHPFGLPEGEFAPDNGNFAANFSAIVDGMLGYSIRGAPRAPVAQWIHAANHHRAPTIALDLPSGLDPDHGTAAGEAIRAAITLTLALPKHGLSTEPATGFIGRVALGDIGIPPSWIAEAVPRIRAEQWYCDGDIRWLQGPMSGAADGERNPAIGIWNAIEPGA
ncbi:MAG: NAD(P)H-hydrate epimerase [Wenzhouxiangellaceae bacterium]|nr:NAD(P)H-hydrate epimerase [Wenzhouxiangellaceae bacterium]